MWVIALGLVREFKHCFYYCQNKSVFERVSNWVSAKLMPNAKLSYLFSYIMARTSHFWTSKWMSNCCLTANEQYVYGNFIMARASHFLKEWICWRMSYCCFTTKSAICSATFVYHSKNKSLFERVSEWLLFSATRNNFSAKYI